MHWLEQWRLEHLMSREELAKKASDYPYHMVSKRQIQIIEEQHGGVIHPNSALLIAQACGASQEQLDSMIPKKWRGKVKLGDGAISTTGLGEVVPFKKEKPKPPEPHNKKGVVEIDRAGRILAKYDSVNHAAKAHGATGYSITKRCAGLLDPGIDEFELYGCSFRFAEVVYGT